jgi:hypothetical protein
MTRAPPALLRLAAMLVAALPVLAVFATAQAGLKCPEEAGAHASDYLAFFVLVAWACMWARMARIALAKQGGGDAAFYRTKLATARFFFAKVPGRRASSI